jgi:hypothetical protein
LGAAEGALELWTACSAPCGAALVGRQTVVKYGKQTLECLQKRDRARSKQFANVCDAFSLSRDDLLGTNNVRFGFRNKTDGTQVCGNRI